MKRVNRVLIEEIEKNLLALKEMGIIASVYKQNDVKYHVKINDRVITFFSTLEESHMCLMAMVETAKEIKGVNNDHGKR